MEDVWKEEEKIDFEIAPKHCKKALTCKADTVFYCRQRRFILTDDGKARKAGNDDPKGKDDGQSEADSENQHTDPRKRSFVFDGNTEFEKRVKAGQDRKAEDSCGGQE